MPPCTMCGARASAALGRISHSPQCVAGEPVHFVAPGVTLDGDNDAPWAARLVTCGSWPAESAAPAATGCVEKRRQWCQGRPNGLGTQRTSPPTNPDGARLRPSEGLPTSVAGVKWSHHLSSRECLRAICSFRACAT
mmetsp:Transcript_178452/g.571782  ORF Transcript_178452/g.571782 Transcript_178452/m.571782 type:complete len:137 (-) Transcript_178452:5-415(-)